MSDTEPPLLVRLRYDDDLRSRIDAAALIERQATQIERLRSVLTSALGEWDNMHAVDAPEWRDTDRIKIYVSVGDLRKARDALAETEPKT